MIISITDAPRETAVVAFGLLLALLVSIRRTKSTALFPVERTQELKGLAILLIVLAHIGYFLVSDRSFLVPLSNYAGVGVDLFFALSGYGLVVSARERPRTIGQFYRKRLPRIYVPVIMTLLLFLFLDGVFLHRFYPLQTTLENFLGIFPQADLYAQIDSPLWFITLLLVYYFSFPFIFRRRFPFLSAIVLGASVWLFIYILPNLNIISPDLVRFYQVHFLAFPLGMIAAVLLSQPSALISKIVKGINRGYLLTFGRFLAAIVSVVILIYTYEHSYVGGYWYQESAISLLTVIALITLFLLKRIDFRLLTLFGAFSFEIYLLHWPLLWRYNFLYGRLPAGTATLLYLALFVGLGYLFQKLIERILNVTQQYFSTIVR